MTVEKTLRSVNDGIRERKTLSKSGTSFTTTKISDLICTVCHTEASKYCCPKCSTLSCSLNCYRNHNVNCTESFFQGLVTRELELERKDKESEESSKEDILSILNRIQTQHNHLFGFDQDNENDNGNDNDNENAEYNQFSEHYLKRIYLALENNDEESLSNYFSPTIQIAFERDVQAGRLHENMFPKGEWIPWWRSELYLTCAQADDPLQHSNIPSVTMTLDERLLAIPPLSKLTSSSSLSWHSCSYPDFASPNLGYNLISIVWSLIETLECYGGPEHARCLEAAETFHYNCPVLSKDARYETVSQLVMEQPRLSYHPKQRGIISFYNDVIIILENPRHIAHLVLDGIDIIQQGAIDKLSVSSARKITTAESLLHKKDRLKWKRVKKKLEYYLSWARDRNKNYWTRLIHELEVWKDDSLI
jgi:hypothetical protein